MAHLFRWRDPISARACFHRLTGVRLMALRVNTSAMRLGFALCLFASLGSCGGGGGSGGGVSSTPTPPSGGSPAPTIDYDTAEYQRSTGPVAMDAIAAYDAGATRSEENTSELQSL